MYRFSRRNAKSPRKHQAETKGGTRELSFLGSPCAATQLSQVAMTALECPNPQRLPRGIIMAESGFTPARALLDHRRARFAQRLYARPQEGQGPEKILERESTLTSRLKEVARVERRGGTAEKQEWEEGKKFGGQTVVEKKEEAFRTAKE